MLFFKEIIDEKFDNAGFKQFYKKECHICSTTMKVVAYLEEQKAALPEILDTLNISKADYEDLKRGDKCHPEMVRQLCDYLGLTGPVLFEKCQRLK